MTPALNILKPPLRGRYLRIVKEACSGTGTCYMKVEVYGFDTGMLSLTFQRALLYITFYNVLIQ